MMYDIYWMNEYYVKTNSRTRTADVSFYVCKYTVYNVHCTWCRYCGVRTDNNINIHIWIHFINCTFTIFKSKLIQYIWWKIFKQIPISSISREMDIEIVGGTQTDRKDAVNQRSHCSLIAAHSFCITAKHFMVTAHYYY